MKSPFEQNIIAMVWDCDKTLISSYMQEPLFRHFNVDGGKLTIRPYPNPSLDFACASYASVIGTVRSSWKYHGDKLEYEFEIPANVEAEVVFPNGEKETLRWGKHNITK